MTHAGDLTANYTWKPMKIGAGGFVSGMWAHPTEPNLIYCRVNVAAGYRWQPETKSWKNLLTASSMPESALKTNYYGVDSIVGAKTDPNCAYMTYNGKVYKSSNRGDTWVDASGNFNLPMDSNGVPYDAAGERLQVDPANKEVVYYGSMRSGLWVTFNGGKEWSPVAAEAVPFGDEAKFKKAGILTIHFDETSGVNDDGRTKTIYVTVAGKGVYQTVDAGKTWAKISGGADAPDDSGVAADAIVDKDGNYYIVYNGIWRYSQGKWVHVLKEKAGAIAVDPFDSNRIIAGCSGGLVRRSTDFGKTWTALSPLIDEAGDTPYLVAYNRPKTGWLSTGQYVFDPTVKGKLWFAEGFGVLTTTDLESPKTINWTYVNNGIEALVANQVCHAPGSAPIGSGWDLGAFRFDKPDKPAQNQCFANKFFACWGIDWMGSNPKNIVMNMTTDYVGTFRNMRGLLKSSDGGLTWTFLSDNLPESMRNGTVAISAGNADHIVWLPANKSGVYYTKDGGATWQQGAPNVSMGWVFYGLERVALASDKVLDDVFYVMCQEDHTLYKSSDGGATWVSTGKQPPGYRHRSQLKATPGKAAHLWHVEGPGETKIPVLWRSTDGGVTWSPCANDGLTAAYSMGFGKEPAPGSYPTIFLSGAINGVDGIYRSTDEGQTWDKIGVSPLGIWGPIKHLDGDKDVFGKVYLAFESGIGFGYGTTNETAGNLRLSK